MPVHVGITWLPQPITFSLLPFTLVRPRFGHLDERRPPVIEAPAVQTLSIQLCNDIAWPIRDT